MSLKSSVGLTECLFSRQCTEISLPGSRAVSMATACKDPSASYSAGQVRSHGCGWFLRAGESESLRLTRGKGGVGWSLKPCELGPHPFLEGREQSGRGPGDLRPQRHRSDSRLPHSWLWDAGQALTSFKPIAVKSGF